MQTPEPHQLRKLRKKNHKLALVERKLDIWEAYRNGQSYREIAELFGLTPQMIGSEIHKYLGEVQAFGVETVRIFKQRQLERIQTATSAIWPKVLLGRSEAINTLIRLMEREAKLLGLDAPSKVDITAKIAAIAQAEGSSFEEGLQVAEGIYREVS